MKKLLKILLVLLLVITVALVAALVVHRNSSSKLSVHITNAQSTLVQVYKGSWNKSSGKVAEKDGNLVGQEKVQEKVLDGDHLAQFDLPTGSYFVYVPTKYGEFDNLPANVNFTKDTPVLVDN